MTPRREGPEGDLAIFEFGLENALITFKTDSEGTVRRTAAGVGGRRRLLGVGPQGRTGMGGCPEVDPLGRGRLGGKQLAGSLKSGRLSGGKRRGGSQPCG